MKQNAEVGADIANSIANLSFGDSVEETFRSAGIQKASKSDGLAPQPRVVCVGGAVIDTIAKSSKDNEMIIGTSNPGQVHCSDGGVGRNVAEVLGRLGSKPLFYTSIGEDDVGQGLLLRLQKECGVATTPESINVTTGTNTAQYIALLDHSSDLVGGVADMDVLSHIPIPEVDNLLGVEYLVLDSNAPTAAVIKAAKNGVQAGAVVCFEPTSVPKAWLLSNKDFLSNVSYMFPNEDELMAMAVALDDRPMLGEKKESSDEFAQVREAASKLLQSMRPKSHIIITLGSRGVLLASTAESQSSSPPVFRHFPAEAATDVKSSNGAGDTLCGSFIHALLEGKNEEDAVLFGMKAALLSLDCAEHAISPHLSSSVWMKYMH